MVQRWGRRRPSLVAHSPLPIAHRPSPIAPQAEDRWPSFGVCPRLMLTRGYGTGPRTQSRSPGTAHLVHATGKPARAGCDNGRAAMWYKNATIPSKFRLPIRPTASAGSRPHRSELRPKLRAENPSKYSRAGGAFCRLPINHFLRT